MKKIIRTLLVVMVFVLVLSSLTGCQGIKDKILGLIRPQPPVTECTHTGGNATCTEKAICSECGEAYGDALGHNYAEGKCTVCGAADPDYVAPHEHNFVDGKCECGEEDPNYVPPHEHEFVDGKCECGEEDPNYVPPHEHVWSDATCTEPQKCECGETQGEALGHDMVDVEAKAHTCTEDGYNAHKACTRCDKTEGKEVDKAAHTLKYTVVLPTATAPGHTTVVCEACEDFGTVVYGDVNVMTEGTYVLDPNAEGLKGTAQGTYTDGQVYVHGGVWEMHMSAKFRMDSSNKATIDGTFLQGRLNWGGKTQFPENGGIINGVVFTTTDETTVKIYWVQGGDDHRQVALYSLAGEIVVQSDNQTAAKNDPCYSEFTVPAGTYVLGNVTNQNYHFRVEVVVGKQAEHEHVFEYGECECGEKDPNYVPPVDNGNHSFDAATDVTVGEDKDVISDGTRFDNGFFKIVGAVTQRVSEGAVYAVEVGKNATGAIEFTLTMKSTVSVVFSSTGGSNTSLVGILDADGNLVANNEGITEVTGANEGKTTLTYTLEPGTYSVVSPKETTTEYKRGARVYSITTAPASEEAPHEHSWTDVAGKDATCTEDGYTAHKVCECGEKQGYEVVPAGHKLVDVEGKAATCTEDGYTAYKACSNCDYTEGKTVLPAGHALVDAEGKAATCTEDGYTAYKACSNCDYTEGKTVLPAGHKLVDVEGKAATCTEAGYTAHKACSNCDYTEGKEVIAAGHKLVDKEGKAATCTEDGYTAYKACSNCDYIEGKEVVGATDHSHEAVVTAPTCTVDGYTTYTCACGDTYTGDVVAAAGHKGYTEDFVCDVCSSIVEPEADSVLTIEQALVLGKLYSNNSDTLTTTNKYYVTGTIVSVDNTTYGNLYISDGTNKLCIYGTYSADGKVRYDAMEVKPAKGDVITVYGKIGMYKSFTIEMVNGWMTEHTIHTEHTYTSVVTEATCTAAGYTVYTCLCGDAYKEDGDEALGHTTDDGVCERCEKTITPGVSAEPTWQLVTDVSTLKAGDQIIIVSADGEYVLSTNQKTNNRAAVAFDINNITEDVQIITLEAGNADGYWAFNVGGKYLYAASTSSNHLKTTSSCTNNNANWSITIALDGVATIKANQSARNWLRFNPNNGSPLFSCYTSGQQNVSIYVLK